MCFVLFLFHVLLEIRYLFIQISWIIWINPEIEKNPLSDWKNLLWNIFPGVCLCSLSHFCFSCTIFTYFLINFNSFFSYYSSACHPCIWKLVPIHFAIPRASSQLPKTVLNKPFYSTPFFRSAHTNLYIFILKWANIYLSFLDYSCL